VGQCDRPHAAHGPDGADLRNETRTSRIQEIAQETRINIPIGTAYLADLYEKFGHHAALVIAAYNAGAGAASNWCKARPGDDLDLFIEDIPYEQTRGYTKRVLSSLATYLFLYDEEKPMLRLDLSIPRI